ncbi:MAG: PQQ-binding-like beta-propeller repeat protein [Candidatus Eremiobacteraeota bacterium]|nr:PQQ-binding-like beta-propeller repeat protein [Candidatus Eremiobacteraeota bacterium]
MLISPRPVAALVLEDRHRQVQPDWSQPVEAAPGSRPVIAGRAVAVGGPDGLSVFSTAGQPLYTQTRQLTAEPVALSDHCLVVADQESVEGLDPLTGRTLWKAQVGAARLLTRVSDQAVAVRSRDRLTVLVEGKPAWTQAVDPNLRGPRLGKDGNLLLWDGLTRPNWVGAQALDPATGSVAWKVDRPTLTINRFPMLDSVESDGARVYLGYHAGQVEACDLAGNSLWKRQVTASPRLVAAEQLYVAGADDTVHTLAPASGDEAWKATAGRSEPSLGPALVTGGASGVTALDPASGRLEWQWTGAGPVTPAQTADGRVYVQADGRLLALDHQVSLERQFEQASAPALPELHEEDGYLVVDGVYVPVGD